MFDGPRGRFRLFFNLEVSPHAPQSSTYNNISRFPYWIPGATTSAIFKHINGLYCPIIANVSMLTHWFIVGIIFTMLTILVELFYYVSICLLALNTKLRLVGPSLVWQTNILAWYGARRKLKRSLKLWEDCLHRQGAANKCTTFNLNACSNRWDISVWT